MECINGFTESERTSNKVTSHASAAASSCLQRINGDAASGLTVELICSLRLVKLGIKMPSPCTNSMLLVSCILSSPADTARNKL